MNDLTVDLFRLASMDNARELSVLLENPETDPNAAWIAGCAPQDADKKRKAMEREISEGQLAVGYAAIRGKAAAVAVLAPISDLSVIDANGNTALTAGAYYGDAGCAKAILAHVRDGETVNAKNSGGDTALMLCVKNNCLEYARALLADARCDTGVKNAAGHTAFQIALESRSRDELSDRLGIAQMLAARTSDQDIAACADALLARGIGFDVFEADGIGERIPLDLAKRALAKCDDPQKKMPKTRARTEAGEIYAAMREARPSSGANHQGPSASSPSEKTTRRKPRAL